MIMKKKIPKETSSFRLAGQRSITSSLTASRSSDRSLITQTGRNGSGEKISLSDFLSKKLHRSSVLPATVKEKGSSLIAIRDNFSGPLPNGVKKANDGVEKECPLDKSAFEKFKPVVIDAVEENVSSCVAESVEPSIKAHVDAQEPKKRQATFDNKSEYEPVKRRVVVLGDDPTPSSNINKTSYTKSDPSASHYNHYADGKGWWDCNMEGIDNEAVGSSEVWEGIGSTTVGGLDWH